MKSWIKIPLLLLSGFAGGFSAQVLLVSTPSEAAAKVMSYFKLADSQNAKGLELYVYNGGPAQNFYGGDGKIRLQLGTYTATGERGLPLISMNDNNGDIRMLLRLAGPNESPVLIMKDKNHRDRMVMGLGLSGNEDPFLATFDTQGRKQMIFGSY